MPTYVYKYRRRYGRRYSRYRRYGAYSRYRRRRGRTSSTATSRGRIRVRVPVQRLINVPVAASSFDSQIVTSCPWYQSSDNFIKTQPWGVCGAVSSQLYRAYVGLYDQVKCDGVVTKLSIVTAIGSAIPAVQVVMAYDRMGTGRELLNTDGTPTTTASLFDYSSASIVSAINNSVAKTSRSCWSSDIQERSVFHDCTLDSASAGSVFDKDYYATPDKCGYFSPLTLIGLRLSAAPSSDTSVQILLEQTYYFTFRQPKYGGSATSADTRSVALVSGVPILNQPRDLRSLDREADMRDVGGLDDEDAQAARPAAQRQATQVLQHDGEDPDEYLSPALQ